MPAIDRSLSDHDRRYPRPREWEPDAPFKSERWDIKEHDRLLGPVDRVVYRTIDRPRIRRLARKGGVVKLSGFQYLLRTRLVINSCYIIYTTNIGCSQVPPAEGLWSRPLRTLRT